ncbi:guanine deaminase [Candidatus Sumerlaeota bacterium]|nr:guanine deaminase [Candidatus Sumerlaeota bacterium]
MTTDSAIPDSFSVSCIVRGALLTPLPGAGDAVRWEPDGALAIGSDGRILASGSANEILGRFPGAAVDDFSGRLILPAFVDAHLHFPQLDIIGSLGDSLLEWLENSALPAELRMTDSRYTEIAAHILIQTLLTHGIATAVIYSSSHTDATRTLFAEAERSGMRALIGKVSMDRHAPAALLSDADRDVEQTARLIEKWHQRTPLLHYVVTPRFAPCCSDELLRGCGEWLRSHPDLRLQTHFAETRAECDWVRELFPHDRDYLAVYERCGLLGPRTILGHAIQIDAAIAERIAESGAAVAHCPSSNLFLGSGLIPLELLEKFNVRVGLGSDIGAGTSVSMWRTMLAAYQVQRLRGRALSPGRLLKMATWQGARALGLEQETGALIPGLFADFQVIDWQRHPLLKRRMEQGAVDADAVISALIAHADDRVTEEVRVLNRPIWQQPVNG